MLEIGSLCIPGWPSAQYVYQTGLRLTEVHLLLPVERWGDRHVTLCLLGLGLLNGTKLKHDRCLARARAHGSFLRSL